MLEITRHPSCPLVVLDGRMGGANHPSTKLAIMGFGFSEAKSWNKHHEAFSPRILTVV